MGSSSDCVLFRISNSRTESIIECQQRSVLNHMSRLKQKIKVV
jgi:hypothetical protein